MATSNGYDELLKAWFWNGKKVTEDRYRYELGRQQEAVIANVNTLITDQATNAVIPAAGLAQQEYGGFLRQIIPALLDQYGNINATAAIQYYDAMQLSWLRSSDAADRRGADRYAAARTKSAIAVSKGYAAQYADTYDTVAKTDAVVNYAMKVRAISGHDASVEAMNNALTREVAMYHRDTVLFNAALDDSVSKVQRVAQLTACEFCRLMALGSTNGQVRVSSYAVKFHDNCHCTIQPLFAGQQPVRPPYYDQFEAEYITAKSEWNGGNVGTDQLLTNWREMTTAKANGTYAAEVAQRK